MQHLQSRPSDSEDGARGEGSLQTSYFRAKNVLEALDKLFFDRDPNSITVFSVTLNPIS